jgi:hypothetical protein
MGHAARVPRATHRSSRERSRSSGYEELASAMAPMQTAATGANPPIFHAATIATARITAKTA